MKGLKLEAERRNLLEDRRKSALAENVTADFEKRRKERVFLERQWELNMNFLNGNQYLGINARGELVDDGNEYYWQGKEVFNHIAPIIDMRLAKFSCVTPTVSVRPKTDDEKEVVAASLAEKLLSSAHKKINMNDVVKKVTVWSETTGTGFYKIVWDGYGGNQIGSSDGKGVYEGEVAVIPVSPFEIFPDALTTENLRDCESVIHARAMTVKAVKEKYGILVVGDKVDVLSLSKKRTGDISDDGGYLEDAVVVIERYEKPCAEFPNGRLLTVAGGKLLYEGELPYVNGENGIRTYPFVKQTSYSVAGSFFGTSVIERLIPVQRAYNAVKNRKHEFMNRLSMGVLTVEDGSVDVDDLASDGLSPGKVLVYRQGSKAPEIMPITNMPSDFSDEEERLLNEFVVISGVSNVTSSASNATLSSGTSLEILVEQDNARLIMAAEAIRQSYVNVSKQIIRLYAQFSAGVRAVRYQDGDGKIKVVYADRRAVSSDDVYLESENELLYTPRQKKEMIFKLYDSGILADENGEMRTSVKEKVLALLGYKELDHHKGLSRLHEEKAQRENEKLVKTELRIDDFDDHEVHVDEHTRFILSEYQDLDESAKQRLYLHVKEHQEKIKSKDQKITGEN